MRFTCFSNKGSSSPLIYLLLQIILVTGLSYTCPNILGITASNYLTLFWINILITVILFFVVHRADPGYIPYDAIFFTDQEEPPLSASHAMKYDSMMKLRAADSRIMYRGFDLSPSAVDGQMHQNILFNKSALDKSKLVKSTLSSTSASKNIDNTLVSPLPNKEKTGENEINHSQYVERDEGLETRVDVCLSKDDAAGQEQEDAIDYEAVMNMQDDIRPSDLQNAGTYNIHHEEAPQIKRETCQNGSDEQNKGPSSMNDYMAKYGVKLNDVVEELDADLTDVTKPNDQSPQKSQPPQKQSINKVEPEDIASNQMNHTNETKMDEISHIYNYTHEAGLGHDLTLRKMQPGAGGSYFVFKEDKSIVIDHPVPKAVVPSADNKTQPRESTVKAATKDENSNAGNCIGDVILRMARSPEKEPENNQQANNRDIENQGSNKNKQDGPETLYVERRYCTACNLDQPLRSKHCRDCNRCTAQYDHHCPWIGTCIGEKNHRLFYFYLIFQFIEIAWGEFTLAENIFKEEHHGEKLSFTVFRGVLLLAVTFFFCMVGSLIAFHSYLATQNMTTWEFLSWGKISYLKEWQSGWGSPFSEGIKKNLAFFFSSKKELRRWKMPKYKAPLDKQNVENVGNN